MPRGLRWTEDEYTTFLTKTVQPQQTPPPLDCPTTPLAAVHPYAPYRSRTEQRYAGTLAIWQRSGLIQRWRYEALRLTLAPRTTLTVDFYLLLASGTQVLDEVKGSWAREDAIVKLKTAAALYPEYRFRLVRWDATSQRWTHREIPAE
jgi:hypothetical protein